MVIINQHGGSAAADDDSRLRALTLTPEDTSERGKRLISVTAKPIGASLSPEVEPSKGGPPTPRREDQCPDGTTATMTVHPVP